MFALGHGLDAVTGKARAQRAFEFEFQHFALELLRALFGPMLEFIDLRAHRRDGLVPFFDRQAILIFRFPPKLLADRRQSLLDALLYSKIKLALGIVQFASLAG